MKTAFRESFKRDLAALNELPHIKKLKGEKNYYRLRIADYRIGLTLESDTVVFVRCLGRKDIYKYFP